MMRAESSYIWMELRVKKQLAMSAAFFDAQNCENSYKNVPVITIM